MKNIKHQIEQLNADIRFRIETGQFDIVKIEQEPNESYLGRITISIDEIKFEMSVSETFVCCFTNTLDFNFNWKEGALKHLHEPIKAHQKALKLEQLKKLQDELERLQTE